MDAFTFSKQPNRLAITYQGPASGKQYELWREGVCRSFCQLDTEPSPSASDRIDCRIDFSFLNGLTLATPTGSSARFARTRELLPDGCDDLVLVFATRGPIHVTGKERTVELATSQACLIEMSAAAVVALNDAGLFTATRMPRRFFLEVAPNAEARLYQPLGETSARMVQRYFALCNDLARDLDAEGRQAAAEHLMELISLLLKTGSGSNGPIEGRRHSAARLDLLKSEALKNLTRDNLSIATISQASGLSARQAQRLFARTGATFTEFVLEQRLSLAHRLLTNPEHRHRKVSDLAYDTGFRDLSYFHRAFRRRFGMTPSDLRDETGSSRLN